MPKKPSYVRAFASLLTGIAPPAMLAISALTPRTSVSAPPTAAPLVADAEGVAIFEKSVRPVLAAQCISCHGAQAQLAGVRLDTAEGVAATVTPGDPAKSRLLRAMHYDGPVKMPPSGKRPVVEIAAFTDWVKRGAPYLSKAAWAQKGSAAKTRTLWSFRPAVLSPVPQIANAATPIDAFLEAKRKERKLPAPARRADKRTLLRRASFDLIGLPPTPAQLTAFLADKSPEAFARAVDRLLASPQYGERWARRWLDVARYTDSNRLDENTAFGNAFRYRDWVVDAVNRDTPYNTFVQEQVAGDLLDSGNDETLRNERITATGFLSLGPKYLAEPDKDKMVMDIVDEQIDVTSKAVMGLTISCARRHDHKFDPISTRDYYALAGIFKSCRTMQTLNTVAKINQRPLKTAALTEAIAVHARKTGEPEAVVAAARAKVAEAVQASLKGDEEKYLKAGWELARRPDVLVSVADTPAGAGEGERLLVEAASFARGNANRNSAEYGDAQTTILNTTKTPFTAEWKATVPQAERYVLEIRYAAEEARPMKLFVNDALASSAVAGGVTGGWKPDAQRWEPQSAVTLVAGVNRLRLDRDGASPHLHRLLLVAAPAQAAANASPAAARQAASQIGKRDRILPDVILRYAAHAVYAASPDDVRKRAALDASLLRAPSDPEPYFGGATGDAFKRASEALAALRKGAPSYPMVMAVEETAKPEDVRIHLRASTQSLGEIAPRGFPLALAKYASPPVPVRASGRRELALWLTRPENPLTARVAVNRVWQHLFGAGLVRTPDNWGVRGEAPTHPELLDYLAITFIKQDGWSQKKLIRWLMLTDAYQMATVASSQATQTAFRTDPENRFLWRANRRRLEAEAFRDSLLFASGRLDARRGGSLLRAMDADYVTNDQSKDRALYETTRRSLYLPVTRNSLYGLFQSYDFGDGATVNAQRANTTVAPQALFALNSPLVRDAAAHFAASLPPATDNAAKSDDIRIQDAYRRAYGRAASPAKSARVRAYLDRYAVVLARNEPDAGKRRQEAWRSFCQALLSLNEFMYVD